MPITVDGYVAEKVYEETHADATHEAKSFCGTYEGIILQRLNQTKNDTCIDLFRVFPLLWIPASAQNSVVAGCRRCHCKKLKEYRIASPSHGSSAAICYALNATVQSTHPFSAIHDPKPRS